MNFIIRVVGTNLLVSGAVLSTHLPSKMTEADAIRRCARLNKPKAPQFPFTAPRVFAVELAA